MALVIISKVKLRYAKVVSVFNMIVTLPMLALLLSQTYKGLDNVHFNYTVKDLSGECSVNRNNIASKSADDYVNNYDLARPWV